MRASCLILLLYLIPSCITDVLRKEICVPGYMVFATVGLCIGLYNVPVFFTILALCSAVMAAIMTYKKIPLKEQVPMLPTITVAYVGTLLLIGIHK